MHKCFRTSFRVAIPAAAAAMAGSAMAEVPAGVTAALGELQGSAVTVATVILIAIVAVYAIKFIRKGL